MPEEIQKNPWEVDWNSQPKLEQSQIDQANPWDIDWNSYKEPSIVAPKKDTTGDTMRGFKTSMGQTVPLLKGTLGVLGATAENLFGEGGYSTDLKQWGLKGYQEGMAKLAPLHHENDDVTVAYEKAKSGDIGAMIDWAQYALGYGAGQVGESAAVSVIGSLAGSAVAPGAGTVAGAAGGVVAKGAVKSAATNLIENLVAKEAIKLTEQNIAKGMAAEAAASAANKMAAKSIGSKIGQGTALGGYNLTQEAGSIYADAEEEAKKQGRQLTGSDIARIWGASILAAGAESLSDKIGLDALTGKIKIPGAGRTGRAVVGGTAGAALEGGTEALQTGLERYGAGKELTGEDALKDYINSAAMGALPGGAFGGARGAMTANVAPTETTAQVPPSDQLPVTAPLQLENTPDPFISFPDGSVGKKSDVDAYINSLPEEQRIDARAKLYGLEAQPETTIADISSAQSVDEAIEKFKQSVKSTEQLESTGSFSKLNEYADLLTNERQNLEQRKAEVTQQRGTEFADLLNEERQSVEGARTEILNQQQEASLTAALADVDARVQGSMEQRTVEKRQLVLDNILSSENVSNLSPDQINRAYSSNLARLGYQPDLMPDESAKIQRFTDIRDAQVEPPAPTIQVRATPNEMPENLVPEKLEQVNTNQSPNFAAVDRAIENGMVLKNINGKMVFQREEGGKIFIPSTSQKEYYAQKMQELATKQEQLVPIAEEQKPTLPYKKGRTGAETARNKLAAENPFLSFLATYGVSIKDRSDVGGERGKAKLVAGHVPLFRKNGLRLDELAQMAHERGFLTDEQMNSDLDNGGVNALSDMIDRSLRNEIVGVSNQESTSVDAEMLQEAHALGLNVDGKSSDEVYDLIKEYYDQKLYEEAVDSLNELNAEAFEQLKKFSLEELLFELGEYNEQARQIEAQKFAPRTEGQTVSGGRGVIETTTEQTRSSIGGGEALALQGETVEEARNRLNQEERQAKDRQKQEIELANQEREARIAKEINARQAESAENFQLGQTAEDSLSGQQDIFSQQEKANPREIIADSKFEKEIGSISYVPVELLPTKGEGLTRQSAKSIQQLGKALGKNVHFFNQKNAQVRLDGYANPKYKDDIFVNIGKGDAGWHYVAGHEFFHQLPTELKKSFIESILPLVPKEKLAGLKNYINQPNLTDKAQWEEIAADLFGNRFGETDFLDKVLGDVKDTSTLTKMVAAIRDFVNNVLSSLKTQGFATDQFVTDLEKVRDSAQAILQEHLAENKLSKERGDNLDSIFAGLEKSGLARARAEQKMQSMPNANEIQYIHDNFLDIIGDLEDAGILSINCD